MMTRLSARYTVAKGGGSRLLEDGAFIVGLILIASRAGVEMGQEIGYWPMPAVHHSLWVTTVEFMRSSLLIAPKMLGRARAGRSWGEFGRGLVGRGKPGEPDA